MGRGNFQKKKYFKKCKQQQNNGERKNKERKSYSDLQLGNENFDKYYKAQVNLFKDDNDFNEFLNSLFKPLPAAFRINSSCFGQTQALKNIVESDEFVDKTDNDLKGVTKLKWYPNGLAYQLNLSRFEIRESEKLLKLQGFLTSESENGYITRQETVSFIPPILLDIKPNHNVLDLCAAPGSKTTQIIEYLNDNTVDFDVKNELTNKGYVVANDLNNSRCYMLVHQCKRFNLANFIVINHDASSIPDLYTSINGEKTKLKFDRILADVPCTGDGTARKNKDVWKAWAPTNGTHLYPLQLKIAKRAAELLAKDGLMVYSTCSFNPVENEAVVLNLLRESEGSLELVDVEDKLEYLKHVNGLEKWVLMQKDLKLVNSFDEVDENYRSILRAEMFAPENVKEYNLKRCVRILPHHQNTGGFFICLIKKKTDKLPWEKSDNEIEQIIKKPRLDQRAVGFKEDPFIFMDKDDSNWLKLKEYYGISDDFPVHRLFRRTIDKTESSSIIYYLTDGAIDFFKNNSDNLHFINFGVRMFTKVQDKVSKCTHRLVHDGIHLIYPYLDKNKIVKLTKSDFECLLNCKEFIDLSTDELNEQTRNKISESNFGCIILEYKHQIKQNDGKFKELCIPVTSWRGKLTIRPSINKDERKHFLRICEFDITAMEQERIKSFEDRKQRRNERLDQRNEKIKQQENSNKLEDQLVDEKDKETELKDNKTVLE